MEFFNLTDAKPVTQDIPKNVNQEMKEEMVVVKQYHMLEFPERLMPPAADNTRDRHIVVETLKHVWNKYMFNDFYDNEQWKYIERRTLLPAAHELSAKPSEQNDIFFGFRKTCIRLKNMIDLAVKEIFGGNHSDIYTDEIPKSPVTVLRRIKSISDECIAVNTEKLQALDAEYVRLRTKKVQKAFDAKNNEEETKKEQEAPKKRGAGRPPGAKNKPKNGQEKEEEKGEKPAPNSPVTQKKLDNFFAACKTSVAAVAVAPAGPIDPKDFSLAEQEVQYYIDELDTLMKTDVFMSGCGATQPIDPKYREERIAKLTQLIQDGVDKTYIKPVAAPMKMNVQQVNQVLPKKDEPKKREQKAAKKAEVISIEDDSDIEIVPTVPQQKIQKSTTQLLDDLESEQESVDLQEQADDLESALDAAETLMAKPLKENKILTEQAKKKAEVATLKKSISKVLGKRSQPEHSDDEEADCDMQFRMAEVDSNYNVEIFEVPHKDSKLVLDYTKPENKLKEAAVMRSERAQAQPAPAAKIVPAAAVTQVVTLQDIQQQQDFAKKSVVVQLQKDQDMLGMGHINLTKEMQELKNAHNTNVLALKNHAEGLIELKKKLASLREEDEKILTHSVHTSTTMLQKFAELEKKNNFAELTTMVNERIAALIEKVSGIEANSQTVDENTEDIETLKKKVILLSKQVIALEDYTRNTVYNELATHDQRLTEIEIQMMNETKERMGKLESDLSMIQQVNINRLDDMSERLSKLERFGSKNIHPNEAITLRTAALYTDNEVKDLQDRLVEYIKEHIEVAKNDLRSAKDLYNKNCDELNTELAAVQEQKKLALAAEQEYKKAAKLAAQNSAACAKANEALIHSVNDYNEAKNLLKETQAGREDVFERMDRLEERVDQREQEHQKVMTVLNQHERRITKTEKRLTKAEKKQQIFADLLSRFALPDASSK